MPISVVLCVHYRGETNKCILEGFSGIFPSTTRSVQKIPFVSFFVQINKLSETTTLNRILVGFGQVGQTTWLWLNSLNIFACTFMDKYILACCMAWN